MKLNGGNKLEKGVGGKEKSVYYQTEESLERKKFLGS